MGQENGVNEAQNGECTQISGLAHINYIGTNPFDLFKEWHKEARGANLVNPDALCFSTSSKEGVPSSRHLLLRRLEDDGFVIMTDGRSRKAQDLAENPHASIAFLWCYRKENRAVSRQVRIEGCAEEVPQSSCQDIWEREPLFCKIRANICDQGRPVDWDEHKRKHDSWYHDIVNNKLVPKLPSHITFYKVTPSFMEFYHAHDTNIGDRLAFHSLNKDVKMWKVERIAA